MDIVISQEQARVPVTVVQVKGRINLGSAAQLEQQVRTAIANGARDVLIDLGEVSSLTSVGLRTIQAVHRLLGDQPAQPGGKSDHLKLLNPTAEVRRVLNIAGFDLSIDIFADKQTALQSF
jgi:anti-anti-sigma factor